MRHRKAWYGIDYTAWCHTVDEFNLERPWSYKVCSTHLYLHNIISSLTHLKALFAKATLGRNWRTLSLMSQNNSLDCFSCKELKNQIVSHEKSATRSIEITVRSDSIEDNMTFIVNNVPSSALSSKASNRKQIGTKYLQQPVGNGVWYVFFFSCLIPLICWLKLLLWSQWSCDGT